MSSIVEQKIRVDEWRGLYRESWKGVICDESFQHPAKFSRALIHKIYEHVIEEGWANKGDSVVDPFGGVALGAFPAMQHGLVWYGCELEEKFVTLGNQNITLWNERYSRMPNWGSARLLQGDSRRLIEVLSGAVDACVSSPPYVLARQDTTKVPPTLAHIYGDGEQARIAELADHRYGDTEGQLGVMKEGDHSLVITSPPYTNDTVNDRNGIDLTKVKKPGGRNSQSRTMSGYGEASGQLGNLSVSSPPYNLPVSQDHNGSRGGQRGTTPSEKGAFVKYGNTEGQLEGLPMEGHEIAISSPPFPQPYTGGGGINVKGYSNEAQRKGSSEKPFDLVGKRTYQGKGGDRSEGNLETLDLDGFQAAISSPPFESSTHVNNTPGDITEGRARWEGGNDSAARVKQDYADYGPNNIGNQRGETFWSASRLILEQLHQVIVPGGHAVFVVKPFVRDKKIVDFPAQWAQLCEAVGFRLLHDHHALLTEHYGTQGGFDGDKQISVARKSFFRRLAESKGSPRIDHENVLCFERP